MFSYSVVEKALAGFFNIEAERRTAFRGRLRHLQKLGLAPAAPGSGRRVQYKTSDVYDLALAMSISEFGADPREIVDDVPTGTFERITDQLLTFKKPTCVYVPYLFSGGKSEILFQPYKDALKYVQHRPRAALIDIDYIFDFMEQALATVKIQITGPHPRTGET